MRNSRELFQGLEISDINDIFVNVKTTYNKYVKAKNNYISYDKKETNKINQEELDESVLILNSNSDFIIHGIAASGKSLLLKRIAINALTINKGTNFCAFYIELRKFNQKTNDFVIENTISNQYGELTNGESFEITNFDRTVLLFDGLDEVKSDMEKLIILRRISYFISDFRLTDESFEKLRNEKMPEFLIKDLLKIKDKIFISEYHFINALKTAISINAVNEFYNEIINSTSINENSERKRQFQIIISSRSIELIEENKLLTSFEKIELLPFDIGQALKLVKKVIPNNKDKSNKFVNAIKNSQLSNSLTRTPMALTITAILFRDGEIDLVELPANITELYNKFSDYYLNRWDTSKGITLQYKFEETKQILAFIAKKLQEKGVQEFPENELKTYLKSISQNFPYEDLQNIDKFINELKDRVGLIQFFTDDKIFKFYHLSFQEYFASIFFDDSNEKMLLDNFLSEWWENTIVFYCGKQPKRDILLKKITQTIIPLDIEQNFRYLSLLSKCIQAAHLISKESQLSVIENLIFRFDQFYRSLILTAQDSNKALLDVISTIDFIIQLRHLFHKIFDTKHLYFDSFSELALNIITAKKSDYSVITLYSLSYFLTQKTNDATYLEEFIKINTLDDIWTRIVYTDIQHLKIKNQVSKEMYKRIERKQQKRQYYIVDMLKQPIIKMIELQQPKKIEDENTDNI